MKINIYIAVEIKGNITVDISIRVQINFAYS